MIENVFAPVFSQKLLGNLHYTLQNFGLFSAFWHKLTARGDNSN